MDGPMLGGWCRRVGLGALALGALSLLSPGCASTSVRSQTTPGAVIRDYGRLMIFVKLKNVSLRQDAERAFQSELGRHRTQIVPSIDLFPPGKSRSRHSASRVLEREGIDAVLTVLPEGHGTDLDYIPAYTTVYEHRDGSATAVTRGGYAEEGEHWAHYRAILHDRVTDRVVWTASMSAQGGSYTNWSDLVKSMAHETSERLIDDHIIR
jgi:hypothetical protein